MANIFRFKKDKSHAKEVEVSEEKSPNHSQGVGDWNSYVDLDSSSTFDRDAYEAKNLKKPEKAHKVFYSLAIGTVSFAVVILIVGVLAVYMMGLLYYTFHFYPNSYVNGIDVSDDTSSDAKDKVRGYFSNYHLVVHLREKDIEFNSKDMGLKVIPSFFRECWVFSVPIS